LLLTCQPTVVVLWHPKFKRQSSLSDLLLFEMEQAPGAPLDEVAEVSSYVSALRKSSRRFSP